MPNVIIGDKKVVKEIKKNKKLKCGSLDETTSLMVEYILEEFDLMFSALEMATCYPTDSVIENIRNDIKSKTLLDVLEEKKTGKPSDLSSKTISQLNQPLEKNEAQAMAINNNVKASPLFNRQNASSPMRKAGLPPSSNNRSNNLPF